MNNLNIFVSQRHPESQTSEKFHFHTYYEFIYIDEGSIMFRYQNLCKQFFKGDIIYIPPFILHKEICNNARTRHIYFNMTYIKEYISPEILHKICHKFEKGIVHSPAAKQSHKDDFNMVFNNVLNDDNQFSYLYIYSMIDSATQYNLNLSSENAQLRNIMNYIEQNYYKKLTLSEVAEVTSLTVTYICKLFKKEMGFTVGNYIKFIKMKHAVYMLTDSTYSISKISTKLSFSSPKHFSKDFKEQYGISPSEYRKYINVPVQIAI